MLKSEVRVMEFFDGCSEIGARRRNGSSQSMVSMLVYWLRWEEDGKILEEGKI